MNHIDNLKTAFSVFYRCIIGKRFLKRAKQIRYSDERLKALSKEMSSFSNELVMICFFVFIVSAYIY